MSAGVTEPDISYLRLVGIGAVIGAPAALIAALYLAFVHQCEHWLWTDLPEWLGADLGYGISLACGFRGGPVFPAIFLGIAIASFAVIWFDASPTWAIAVGTAAGMTAGTSFFIAALLFSALLVGGNGIDTVPAAVLGAAAAWLTTRALGAVTSQEAATPA